MAWFRRRLRGYLIDVHLAARLQPMHRGKIFEDPLETYLNERYPGSAISGGGTEVGADERIRGCDIEIFVPETFEPGRVAEDVLDRLRRAGVPSGSTMTIGDVIAPVDSHGVVALRFPAVVDADFEDDGFVPHSHEIDAVVTEIEESLGPRVSYVSWQIHRDGSDLYVYGPSADDLRAGLDGLSSTRQAVEVEVEQ